MPCVEEIIKKAMDAPHTVSGAEIAHLEKFAEVFLDFLHGCEPRPGPGPEPEPETIDLNEAELRAIRDALFYARDTAVDMFVPDLGEESYDAWKAISLLAKKLR